MSAEEARDFGLVDQVVENRPGAGRRREDLNARLAVTALQFARQRGTSARCIVALRAGRWPSGAGRSVLSGLVGRV